MTDHEKPQNHGSRRNREEAKDSMAERYGGHSYKEILKHMIQRKSGVNMENGLEPMVKSYFNFITTLNDKFILNEDTLVSTNQSKNHKSRVDYKNRPATGPTLNNKISDQQYNTIRQSLVTEINKS